MTKQKNSNKSNNKADLFAQFFMKFKEIVTNHLTTGIDRKKIKEEIEKEWEKISPYPIPYQIVIFLFLSPELRIFYWERISIQKDAFEKIFRDDLMNENNGEYWVAHYTLMFEGLYDLVTLDTYEFFSKANINGYSLENIPLSKIDSKFVKGINSHAKYEKPVLIIGDTGTSKEAAANTIFKLSDRREKKYIQINCVAIPETLLESELFGYEKGAFTGATLSRKGKFELANEGTILLDELGKLPDWIQAKLLRVIESEEIWSIGADKPRKIDVRIIATAQKDDLAKMLPDLKYRFGYPYVINMPTLNERLNMVDGKLAKLIIHNSLFVVLCKYNMEDQIFKLIVSNRSVKLLMNYYYEGNYRELESILLEAVISAKEDGRAEIQPKDLSLITNKIDVSREKPYETKANYADIKFKDIFEYADKVTAFIVEEKICELLEDGKDFKTALKNEGISSKNEYLTYTRKIKKYTGKGIRDIVCEKQ